MTATASQLPPPPSIDVEALRASLEGIQGIAEVRLVRGVVWAIVDAVHVDRDAALAGALAEALPAEIEFHTTTVSRLGMVPDGQRIV